MAKRVAGAGIEVNLLAAGWLLARDEDADPGAVVPRVGQGGQGMGAGRGRRAARRCQPAGGDGRRCRQPSPFPGLAPGWPDCLAFGWILALAWGKIWAWGRL